MRVYVYRKQFTNPGAVTLLQLHAAADSPLVILRAWLNQQSSTTSTAGGAQLGVKSTGATVTAATIASDIFQLDPGDADASLQSSTSGTGHTATAEGTDGDIYIQEGFNWVGNGWLYLPVPEERIWVSAGTKFALKNLVSFTGTVNAGIVFGELG